MVRIIKSRVKRSRIWSIEKEKLLNVVNQSTTIKQILGFFNLENKGGNYKTLQRRLKEDNIDFSHITIGLGHNKNKKFPKAGLTKEECLELVFIENSLYKNNTLRRYLKKFNLLSYKCLCGIEDFWFKNKLNLQIDHQNGISNDNRLVNLRWLCPNCHSQTETFCGKKNKIKKSIQNPNWRNQPHFSTRKVERPSKENLEKLVWEKPSIKIAKDFGVSDSAISKWCKAYGISKPKRGYWTKIQFEQI